MIIIIIIMGRINSSSGNDNMISGKNDNIVE